MYTNHLSMASKIKPPLWTVYDPNTDKVMFRATTCKAEAVKAYRALTGDLTDPPVYESHLMQDFRKST